jgi:cytochrome d ubiquinol oxidase subunit I
MEMVSFAELVMNPVAQVKFVHTVASGYTTGAMFILGISGYYLLKKRDVAFARRSFAIAASFGMASILSVIVLGDESGYELGDVQKVKLAAIEAEWHTEEAPAAFTVFGLPNQETMHTDFAIKIPYVMGIIATRSFDEQVTGLRDLKVEHEERIRNGMYAYDLLQKLRAGDRSDANLAAFDEAKKDLGYGLLLKRYTDNVTDATEEQIKAAADDSIPTVWPLFWSFRIMVACGFIMLFVFGAAFVQTCRQKIEQKQWVLKAALLSIPLPWIAIEAGWFVAEYGRQPWAVGEILPVHVAASALSAGEIWLSLAVILALYTVFLIAEVYLMVKFARKGPSSLKTGRYHFEQNGSSVQDTVNRQVEA